MITKTKEPLVSVIVTTKNSARTIYRCLDCIKKQSYKNIEIIVVDNNSDDQTKWIAEHYFTKLVFNHGPERSAQRNLGIKKACGDYILYLDSDQYIHRDTIKHCLRYAETTFDCELNMQIDGYDMVSIPELNYPDTFFNKSVNYEKKVTAYHRDRALPRFFKRRVFDVVGLFNEERTFDEDIEFVIRAKDRFFSQTHIDLALLHDEGTNLKSMAKKYRYYGARSSLNSPNSKDTPYNKEIKKFYSLDGRFFANCILFAVVNPILFCTGMFIKAIQYISFSIGMKSGQNRLKRLKK